MATDPKNYREYLDKEMTIMGILSAVAIAAPAGILSALIGEKSWFKEQLWGAGPFFVWGASILCTISAAVFYKQRSLLAWFYGQISLLESLGENSSTPQRLKAYMKGADAWSSWISYSLGFTSLFAGFLEYALALFLVLSNPTGHWFAWAQWIGRYLVVPGAIGIALLQSWVLSHYSLDEEPWQAFLSDLKNVPKASYPHEGVYTRLKQSGLDGIGVFAIRDIPKGTYIFAPDDDQLKLVRRNKVENINPALAELYSDFCVLNGDKYSCPSSFNKLTPAWYLNTSRDPNVGADLDLKFYALRDINAGEELTADYAAYSENEQVYNSETMLPSPSAQP